MTNFISNISASDVLGISPNAAHVRDRVPRILNKDATFDPDAWFRTPGNPVLIQEYASSVGSTAAYGLILSFLAFLLALIYLCGSICRCCCRACGNCTPKEKSYIELMKSKRNKYIALGLIAVFVILMIVFASLGLEANSTISDGISGDEGIFQVIENLVNEAFAKIDEIKSAIDGIVSAINSAVLAVSNLVITAPLLIKQTPDEIAANLTTLSQKLSNSSFTVSFGSYNQTFTCQPCLDAASFTNSAALQIRSSTDAVFDPLIRGINSTVDAIVDQKDSIIKGINDAVSRVTNTSNVFRKAFRENFDPIQDATDAYDTERRNGSLILLLSPLFAVVTLILALVFKSPVLFRINSCWYCFVWFILGFIIAGHLPLSLLLADTCLYIETKERTITGFPGKIRDVCIYGQSVDTVFNFSEFLSFREQINLNQFDQSDFFKTLNFTDSRILNETIMDLSTSSFGDAFSTLDSDLASFSTSQGTLYTRSNISSAPASPARDVLVVRVQAESQVQTLVTDLQAAMRSISGQTESIREDLLSLNSQIQNLETTAIDPLFNSVDTLVDEFECSLVGRGYKGLKKASCEYILDGMTQLALYAFLIVLVVIPSTFVWCSAANAMSDQNFKRSNERRGIDIATPQDLPQSNLRPGETRVTSAAAASAGEVAPPPPSPSAPLHQGEPTSQSDEYATKKE